MRELLTNAVKHAHATRVAVSITRAGDQIAVVVEDDGVGFDPEEAMARMSISERISIRKSSGCHGLLGWGTRFMMRVLPQRNEFGKMKKQYLNPCSTGR